MTDDRPILTPRDLADALQVSESVIRAMANRGDIPASHAFRIGKLWRFHASVLDIIAPSPDTIPRSWPPAHRKSASQNARPTAADGASAGENTADNPKNEAGQPAKRRKNAQTRSGSAFARDFPDYANRSRPAS